MGKSILEFHLTNQEDNSSMVLIGEIPHQVNDNGTEVPAESQLRAADGEDGRGALLYVVAVIVVYGMSMCLLVVTLTKRKSNTRITDKEVMKYMKGMEEARQQARVEEVLRCRLRWPGNWIGLRSSSRKPVLGHPGRAMRAQRPGDGCESDTSDYIEYPATTVAVDTEENADSRTDPEEVWLKRGSLEEGVIKLPSRRRGAIDHYRMMQQQALDMEEISDTNEESSNRLNTGPSSDNQGDYDQGSLPTIQVTVVL